MHPEEYRCGLKWILGLPFRQGSYRCPDCGREADEFGVHAVTCQRSGAIGRGHTILRDTVGKLAEQVVNTVTWEAPFPALVVHHPGAGRRPADLLFSWQGRLTAVDFTVITPVRSSAPKSGNLMDATVALKERERTRTAAQLRDGTAFRLWPQHLGRSTQRHEVS